MDGFYRRISLSGADWFIHDDENGRGGLPASAEGWLPARVPGNIQSDLENSRCLAPIWYGAGEAKLFDIAMKDWWYKKTFSAPTVEKGRRATLVFGGVDYACEVYLNGKFLTRNEGMFNRFEADVTNILQPGANELAVKIDRMPAELLEYLMKSDGKQSGDGTPYFFVAANNLIRQTLKGLKSPANCSYDWGTNIYTLGIWKDVSLELSGEARITWMQVIAETETPYEAARVRVLLETDCADKLASLSARVNLEGVTADAHATEAPGVLEAELTLLQPRLWWPNGFGKPELYSVSAVLSVNGAPSHEKTDTFGIRDVRWELTEGAPEGFANKFQLVVNGRPVRTMGSNFVTPDLLFGRATARCRHFVELAKACNMNALRQHGGQIIFDRDFYDAADENGILLLVDFPIGNCIIENDGELLKNLSDTVGNIVRQLRNHPSIVEWTGGNELEYHFNKNADRAGVEAERGATLAADSTRVFRDTCPVDGARHAPWDYNMDIHYRYYNRDLTDNFGKLPLMRYGEFGCQTPANLETWLRDIPVASQWPINNEDPVLIRKNAVNSVFDDDVWLCKERIERLFGPADGLENLLREGQLLGAEGLRYAMDALRAKGKRIAGFTNWDYNEPWPNGAGSYMVDYDGRPVMAYYYVKQALAPLALQLKYDSILYDFFGDTHAELLLVSDAPKTAKGLCWEYKARDRAGAVFAQGNGEAEIAPMGVSSLARVRLNPPESKLHGPSVVELALYGADNARLCERLYVFGAQGARAPLAGMIYPDTPDRPYGVPYVTTGMYGGLIARTRLETVSTHFYTDGGMDCMELTLRNIGEMTAFYVELHSLLDYRCDLFIDNNFAFVPAGEERTITVRAKAGAGLTLGQTGWRVHCWNMDEDLIVDPNADLLLYMGRRDSTCREFGGYLDAVRGELPQELSAAERIVDSRLASWILDEKLTLRFQSNASTPALLRLCTADQSALSARVSVTLNGETVSGSLPKGLGAQKENPQQLAYPHCALLALSGVVVPGENLLEIRAERGWFTWDALQLLADREGR